LHLLQANIAHIYNTQPDMSNEPPINRIDLPPLGMMWLRDCFATNIEQGAQPFAGDIAFYAAGPKPCRALPTFCRRRSLLVLTVGGVGNFLLRLKGCQAH
tara:strand:- start:34 stop:333 length:300 start_codon:yes stop_codon:yes gene_type:complete